MQQRILDWEGCYNVRDLGGLVTGNGRFTAYGHIIRSDMLSRLTTTGRAALAAYGVQTIIDLRGSHEVKAAPYQFDGLAQLNRPTYRNLPLEKDDPAVSALIHQAKTRPEVYKIILTHYPDAIAAVLQAIAKADKGGVVIHCHAGKDRTGIVVALLLRLAGVTDEVIAADYAASQACLWPLYEKLVTEAGGEEKVDPWLKPIATSTMILEPLAYLDKKYGGVESYLLRTGVTETELEPLRKRLLGEL